MERDEASFADLRMLTDRTNTTVAPVESLRIRAASVVTFTMAVGCESSEKRFGIAARPPVDTRAGTLIATAGFRTDRGTRRGGHDPRSACRKRPIRTGGWAIFVEGAPGRTVASRVRHDPESPGRARRIWPRGVGRTYRSIRADARSRRGDQSTTRGLWNGSITSIPCSGV